MTKPKETAPAAEPPSISPEIERKLLSDYSVDHGLNVENQQPGYTYYLAAKDANNPASVQKLNRIGYEVVRTDGPEKVPHFEGHPTPDNIVQYSDLVLMKIPTHHYEYRQKKIRELGQMRAAQVTETTLETMERLGGREVSMQGGSRTPKRRTTRGKLLTVGLDTSRWSNNEEEDS